MPIEGEAAPATEGEPATPVEGEEQTPVEGGEGAPAEDEGEKTPEQVAAEAAAAEEAAKAKPPTAAEAFAALPEAEQQKAAERFANKTMAAARRAEARVEAAKTENTKLTGELGTYREFVQQLASGDPAALARVGFKSPRDYLDKVVAFGSERPAPKLEDEVAALKKERDDERTARARAEATAKVEASKAAVFKAVGERVADLPWLSTKVGRTELWSAIEAYHAEHGECPDASVWALAEELQREMTADLGPAPKKDIGQSQPANKGTPAGTASPATLNPGKTLTGKGSASAPTVKEYSPDDNVRRRQLEDELRAEGLL